MPKRPIRKQTVKQRAHKLYFVLRYAYRVPPDILDQVDFLAYADPDLDFKENLKLLVDTYPGLADYMPKNYQVLAEKYESEWYNYLYEVLLGAVAGDERALENMRMLGFERVEEFAKKLVEEGVITEEERREILGLSKEEAKPRFMEQKRVDEYLKREIEEEKRFEEMIPDEVKRFCDLLKLEVVGKPEYKRLEGFTYDTWIIPVRDEGTGLTVRIIKGHPVTAMHLYKIARIMNREHNPVNVLTFREDYEKLIEPKTPSPTDVRRATERAKVEVEKVAPRPKPRPAPKVNWRAIKGFARRGATDLAQMERAVETKRAYVLWGALKAFKARADLTLEELTKAVEELKAAEERKAMGERVLTDEDIRKLWEEFSRILTEKGLNPERFRERFDAVIDVSMSYEDNLFIVTDEARVIVAENYLRTEGFRVGIPVKKFSWKYVSWGLGAIKVQLMNLELAADEKDALRCYNILKKISETSQTLIDMLEQLPEIRTFKRVTGP